MEGKSLFEDLIGFDEAKPLTDDIPEQETQGEEVETSGEEPESDTEGEEESTEVVADERVEALYQFLVNEEFISEREDFKGTTQELEEILTDLPRQYFMELVESIHPDAQELLQYAVQLGEGATVDALRKFFSDYVEPSTQAPDLDDDEVAYNYLKSMITGTKLFPSEDQAVKYLDGLVESGVLTDTAKQFEEERLANITAKKTQEMEAIKAQQEAQRAEQEKFYATLYDEVKKMPWQKPRKDAVLKNLEPAEVQRKNQLIQASPKALIQLADLYSYFDEKTGEFDLSKIAAKAGSKEAVQKKEQLQSDGLSSVLGKIKPGKGSSASTNESFWSHFTKTD